MFETMSRAQQGDLGEARAAYELVKLGYKLSKPLHNHVPYDLIGDKDGRLYKIQIKTSGYVVRESRGAVYQVQLATSGGNTKINTRKDIDLSVIDFIFVLTSDDRCWLIPATEIVRGNYITVGTKSFEQFQISGYKNEKPKRKPKIDKRFKVPPFTKEELNALIWKHPTYEVGKMFNISDNGISRWVKKWGLTKPPRGYWQKQNIGLCK